MGIKAGEKGIITSGCKPLDELLDGGFRTDTITQLYGPASSGKTNICMQTILNCIKMGNKAIFIDPEGSFSQKRLQQICGEDLDAVLHNTYLLEPADFEEQEEAIMDLEKHVSDDIALVVIDSIVFHYRLELNDAESHDINRRLGKQLAKLLDIARKRHVVVIVTNQVYTDAQTGAIEPVGGYTLKYPCKTIVELTKNNGKRAARLIRHPHKREGEEIGFEITQDGVK